MSSPTPSPGQWHPRHNPWTIAFSVMLATFMEVLDTSVANVALPHIAGSLAASNEEATWVLTSYLVSNAIVLPITGWLGNRFGRKCVLLYCIIIFTLASALCGMAFNLGFLIIARVLQGAGGGALQPISQAILLESFPPEKRGSGMAAFAMGIVVAPILGPTLGGWITDNYSWRWIFYINVPIGTAAVFLVGMFIEDPPYIQVTHESVDYVGFALLAFWLSTMQIVLDKGQEKDWFGTIWIVWFTCISVCSFIGFVLWELYTEHPIVDLCVLKNRNFAVGTFLIMLMGGVLYGTIAGLPLFLQTLLNFPALQSGLAVSPRGIGAFVGNIIIGRIVAKVSNRLLIGFGFILLAISSYMFGNLTLQAGMAYVFWPGIINGLAISCIFVPLTTITMGFLPQEQISNASGIFNLMRNLGGSIGISALTTLLARRAQVHQSLMVRHLTPLDPAYQQALTNFQGALTPQSGGWLGHMRAFGEAYNTLLSQATLWAFVDIFRLFGLLCLLCAPVVFLFHKLGSKRGTPVMAH